MAKDDKKKPEAKEDKATGKFIAKKDFEIHHNDFHLVIRRGDDLSEVPKLYHQNLRTEDVL